MAKQKIGESSFTLPVDITQDFRESPAGIRMLVGLIGAGKTTLAQQLWATDPKKTIRSSLDEIIQMISFYSYEPEMSDFYSGIERSTIINGLLDGYKVIIDEQTSQGKFAEISSRSSRISGTLAGIS
jgi:hypothetical protein